MEEISPYFGKIFRIKIIDDRIIEGEFQAVDKDMSIVLGSGIEYHGVPNGDVNLAHQAELVRKIGMTIIPGKVIVSISLQKQL